MSTTIADLDAAARHRGGDPRLGRHAVAADVVALPQAQAGGGQRGDRRAVLPGRGRSPTSSPTPTRSPPRPSAAHPAAADPLVRRDGRFSPHVDGLKGARDPLTFKRVYAPDPSEPRDRCCSRRASSTSCSA